MYIYRIGDEISRPGHGEVEDILLTVRRDGRHLVPVHVAGRRRVEGRVAADGLRYAGQAATADVGLVEDRPGELHPEGPLHGPHRHAVTAHGRYDVRPPHGPWDNVPVSVRAPAGQPSPALGQGGRLVPADRPDDIAERQQ